MKINDISTNRCLLREIRSDDAPILVKWRQNPEVFKFFKNPIKISLDSHIKWFQESYKNNPNRIDLIAVLKDEKKPIGVFSVNRIDEDTAEVSYLLDDTYQGKGYASEILLVLEDTFKERWNISNYLAEIHKDNIKSISFIKKLGYSKTDERDSFLIYGKHK